MHSSDKAAMEKAEKSFDFMISTIPQPHDANPFIKLLKRDGILTIVGCIAPLTKPLDLSEMIMNRRTLSSSVIGGIAETQEVLDFCAEHDILPDTKLIGVDEINEAFKEIDKGEIDYRYVIDMSSIENHKEDKGILESIGLTSDFKKKPH